MPKCKKCRKKGIHLLCNFCKHEYCSSCIQLESHQCPGLLDKCKKDLTHLEKTLVFSPKKKHTHFLGFK
jgi:hypothetical protein